MGKLPLAPIASDVSLGRSIPKTSANSMGIKVVVAPESTRASVLIVFLLCLILI